MSLPPLDYDDSRTHEFLGVVRRYVINPLETSGVADNCFAAAMLIFGSVDGLGKLIHTNPDAGVGDRFKYFLSRLGPTYENVKEDLWSLRNSLAHNSMNVACFMSKTVDARGEHLEREHDFVFVHTGVLLDDFKLAIDKLESDFRKDVALLQVAESRLEWGSINQPEWRGGAVKTTPPPGIRFVRSRKHRSGGNG